MKIELRKTSDIKPPARVPDDDHADFVHDDRLAKAELLE
jgi:hypothetical protein